MEQKPKVLILCTHNPTRGGMAEGFLRRMAGADFISASAGVDAEPVNPLAIDVMHEIGIDISTQHSKHTAEALKERFAFVISVCDQSKERNPIFPFAFRIVKWSLEDPEEGGGSHEEQLSRFRRVRDLIERNVQEFLAGPAREAKRELNPAH
jgi:protein-tyrosine-phosphatase